MKVKAKEDISIYICISLIIVPLIISYAMNSYTLYYTPDLYYSNSSYSSTATNILVRISMYLSYGACIFLFTKTILNRSITKHRRFIPYFFMLLNMVFIIAFITDDPVSFLSTPGMWSDRLSIITLFSCSIFFWVYQPLYWEYTVKLLKITIVIVTIIVFIFLLTKPEIYSNRLYAFKWIHGFGIIIRLMPFLFLTTADNIVQKWLAVFIIVIDILTLIVLQTRLYFLDIILYSGFFWMLFLKNSGKIKKDKHSKFVFKVGLVVPLLIVVLGMALFSINNSGINLGNSHISASMKMFANRLFENTRSEQYEAFFSYFWNSFPFGVGYNTKGIMSGTGLLGIDNGYLNTLYIVGLPMLILFIIFTMPPILSSWRKRLSLLDMTIVARATAWIIILATSTTTAYTIEFLMFIICAGRCAWLVDNKKNGEVK